MAKYSTGDSGGKGDGGTCELCGTDSDSLRTATISGATLQICPDCAPHDDATNDTDEDSDRNRRAARNMAAMHDAQASDTTHWEREGTNYDDDQLPYLVSDYDDRVREARQETGLRIEELAADLDVPEDRIVAVEQGRATRAGVGGSLIADLESTLDITLAE